MLKAFGWAFLQGLTRGLQGLDRGGEFIRGP